MPLPSIASAGIVKSRLAERPFVVVSAMAKVTDQLLAMAAAAGRGDRDQALEICRKLRERHYLTAGELLGTGLHTESAHRTWRREFDSLERVAARDFRRWRTDAAHLRLRRVVWRATVQHDRTAAFVARDIPAALVDARKVIVTDAQHMRAVPQVEEINDRLRDQVHAADCSSGECRSWADLSARRAKA